jgi:hypothetical protein
VNVINTRAGEGGGENGDDEPQDIFGNLLTHVRCGKIKRKEEDYSRLGRSPSFRILAAALDRTKHGVWNEGHILEFLAEDEERAENWDVSYGEDGEDDWDEDDEEDWETVDDDEDEDGGDTEMEDGEPPLEGYGIWG